MTLAEIDALARFIGCFDKLVLVQRVADMTLKLTLAQCQNPSLCATLQGAKSFDVYLAMTRGKSFAYTTQDLQKPPQDQATLKDSKPESLSPKRYNAPFDVALSRLNRSKILSATLYDDDRILRLELLQQGSYKQSITFLQCEFTGKHTNAIILTHEQIIIDALRHISQAQSHRQVKVGYPLAKIPKNPKKPAPQCTPLALESIPKLLLQAHNLEQSKALESLRHSLLSHYTRTKARLQALLDTLPKETALLQESRTLNHQASLLLSHLHTLSPYQSHATITDNGTLYHINLPASKTPQEAINKLFSTSKKLAQKARNIHKEATNLEEKIAFLDKELAFIARADKLDTLAILAPKKIEKRQKPSNDQAYVIFIQGVKISIGRNERENIKLLESARADDLWMHIRDIPSSHLIIHCGKNALAESIIYKAGEILLGVSGLKQGDFLVDYTKRKFVKITSGACVIFSKHQSLRYRV